MVMGRFLGVVFGAAVLATPVAGWSNAAVGRPLPSFSATDLQGRARSAQELNGTPTILIVVPGQDAATSSESWGNWVLQSYGKSVRRVVVVALDLPFFVPEGVVRDKARSKTPKDYWPTTWLGIRGDVHKALGIPGGGSEPYIYTIDRTGKVTARIHGPMNEQNQKALLAAMPKP